MAIWLAVFNVISLLVLLLSSGGGARTNYHPAFDGGAVSQNSLTVPVISFFVCVVLTIWLAII